jgi:apolipoprotein N-acyltransferase
LTALLGACITAGLYASIFPPFDARALSWIALVPLVRAMDGAGGVRSALLAGVFGFVTTVTITAWLVPTTLDYFERPLLVTLAFSAVVGATCIAPYFALCFGVLGHLQRRLPRIVWLLLIPVAWVAAEYTRTQLGLRSSWGLLGVAQSESPRIRQIADLTGIYGVSALVALGNVCVAELVRCVWDGGVRSRFQRDRWMPGRDTGAPGPGPLLAAAVVFALLLLVSLDHGATQIERARTESVEGRPASLEVMLVQGNVDADKRWRRGEFKHVLMHYGDLTRRALERSDSPPDLIIWPESAIQTSADDPIFGPPLQRMVDGWSVPLIVGAPRRDEGGAYNSAFFLRPHLPPAHYDKNRLLPFSEVQPMDSLAYAPARGDAHISRYQAGTEPGLFDVKGERLGVLICFEAIYPSMARRVAGVGSSVLVNLSNDGWYRGTGGPEQHLQHVIFRSIETGLPMLRVTTTGITAVVSATGEVVARAPEGEGAVLRARVPAARAEPTFYAVYGDWFAIGCGSLLALAFVLSFVLGPARVPERIPLKAGLPGA